MPDEPRMSPAGDAGGALRARIAESFARQSMMQTLGARLETVAMGQVSIAAPILAGARQQHGHAHAALTFALADSAAGYAALTLMDPQAEVLTAEMKINLLAPARGERLRATGRVVRPGRRLVVVEADVMALDNGKETRVAVCLGTMVPVTPGPA